MRSSALLRRGFFAYLFRPAKIQCSAASYSTNSTHGQQHAGVEPRDDNKYTNFGYSTVLEEDKARLVGDVFSNVAESYDRMNDVMSVGLHRLWKDRLVTELRPFPGMTHLDVAGGTGDVAFRVFESILEAEGKADRSANNMLTSRVIVCDINPSMLQVGRQRARARGWEHATELEWLQGDAEALPLGNESIDSYSVAFGVRNMTHVRTALAEAHRVLKRGGRFLCLELSHVEGPAFKELYDVYSFQVIPRLGQLVANDGDSYRYLVESIRKFPKQPEFALMLREAGFVKVKYENLVGGVVAIHSGFKV